MIDLIASIEKVKSFSPTTETRLLYPPVKALVKKHRKKGLWLEDISMPLMGSNDVLIKVINTAICGTDVHIYHWDDWAQKTIPTPMTIGHEFVGKVIDTGSDVNNNLVGKIVSGEGHISCSSCRNCLAGRRHLCAYTSGVGVNRPGAFAEYISLPASNVWQHPSNIDLEVAALFDPLGNAVHSALQYDLLGEDILITGAGPIGAMAAAICSHSGARHIVVTDVNPTRLAMAKKLGATQTVDIRYENLSKIQQTLGMEEGFDIGIEMSGNADALRSMILNMRHGGNISLLGIPDNETHVDWSSIVFKMLTIKGIYGREIYETWYKMAAMLTSGLDISSIITHRFHYTEFQQGFDVIASGHAGKVILNWDNV